MTLKLVESLLSSPVCCREQHPNPERNTAVAKDLDGNCRPNYLLDISPDNCDLSHYPQDDTWHERVLFSTQLGEVLSCRDA